ncbi:hypothetical protein K457DRAFT_289007 [Linnemannia elongata AG-77]|uniref:Uncharacterized protein n=1 Tax=Linnemannia elongata AG-77 TaxID=1314771 RepID=A0A197K621_9FUNG|nr:hypothetical protein K457DRAFT_289007 [Linnemannia elongata AG-77]
MLLPFHGSGVVLWIGSHFKKMKNIPLPFLVQQFPHLPPVLQRFHSISVTFMFITPFGSFAFSLSLSLFA